ncbi:MAG: D-2-hydroxyacid dehydrogenase [Mogibacterium sp.]|nr:D-2-hydroxyacid dehydrogenase [Mogibacterium sp.]
MKKCYAICDFLSDANKQQMRSVAEECGFEMGFFDSGIEAAGKIGDAEVVYCDEGELLKEMPRLKWCHSVSAGVGHFLKSGVFDRGDVLLSNSSGAYGLAISEHIIMVTLLLMRRMPEYFKVIEERGWTRDLKIRSIKGSVIAIAGTGNLGQNAAKRFRALGAGKVIGFSRSGKDRDFFDEVFRMDDFESVLSSRAEDDQIDVLVLCVPGTSESDGLLSAERIALLPEKAFVINVGRGTVVDQEALIEALNEGRIAGAALDVMYPEPLPSDHPLWTAKNCIITPHISGDMGLPETIDITVDIFCENLRRYTEGRELTNLIDINAGY